jgi:hypothetical protein
MSLKTGIFTVTVVRTFNIGVVQKAQKDPSPFCVLELNVMNFLKNFV